MLRFIKKLTPFFIGVAVSIEVINSLLIGHHAKPKGRNNHSTERAYNLVVSKKEKNSITCEHDHATPTIFPKLTSCTFITQWLISYVSTGKSLILTEDLHYANT